MTGTPDAVMRMLEDYRLKRLTHLSLNFHQPGQDAATVCRSMKLFAKELLPEIRKWPERAA